MYGIYIFRLYEKMIKDLKLDGDLKDKYMSANKKMLDIYKNNECKECYTIN